MKATYRITHYNHQDLGSDITIILTVGPLNYRSPEIMRVLTNLYQS